MLDFFVLEAILSYDKSTDTQRAGLSAGWAVNRLLYLDQTFDLFERWLYFFFFFETLLSGVVSKQKFLLKSIYLAIRGLR